jgi:uncharacterized protein YceK
VSVNCFLEKVGFGLLLVVALVLSGCGASTTYTSVQPKLEAVAGTYTPTRESADLLVKWGYARTNRPVMILFPDGKFKMFNLPGCWLRATVNGPKSMDHACDSGAGKWKICDFGWRAHRSWGLLLEFTGTSGTKSTPSKRVKTPLRAFGGPMLKHERPPYRLSFFVGDPDDREVLEFRKVAAATNGSGH